MSGLIPLLIIVAAPGISAPGGRIALKVDDGVSAGANDYAELAARVEVKELIRFEAPARMKIDRLRVFLEGEPGEVTVHVWKDIDSSIKPYVPFRHFEHDLVSPIGVRSGRGMAGGWVPIDLGSRSFVLEKGQRVFVGRFVKPGPQFVCDKKLDNRRSCVVEMYDPSASGPNQVRLIAPAGDFLVRLEGTSFAEERGIRFREMARFSGMPGSIVIGDIDGDGWEDIVADGSTCYKSRRGSQFSKAFTLPGKSEFGLLFDFDNDGDLDLFRGTSNRSVPDSLWRNDGRGHFSRVKDALPEELLFGRSACAFDYDGDGRLDLFVANGSKFGDLTNADPSRLYRNRGHAFQSVFRDVFARGATPPFGSSLSFAPGMLFVGTYRLEPDQLWTFSSLPPADIAPQKGVDRVPTPSGGLSGGHCLGSQWADFDNDGDLDLVVANLMHPDWRGYRGSCESMLFESRGEGRFRGITLRSKGIDFEETPANPILADFDNDGRLDLFHHSLYHSANVYAWRGGGWVDRTASSGLAAREATAVAACDFDRDGRIDLAVADRARGLILYRNVSPSNNWIELGLQGTKSNRDAAGAVVRLRFGKKSSTRLVSMGRGIACQDSKVLHFGLGSFVDRCTAEITWPSGKRSLHRQLALNQLHFLKEPQ